MAPAPPPYAVDFSRTARKELAALPADVRARIAPHITALALAPRPPGCVKLVGPANQYRIRVGAYRVVYEIHDARLLVLVLRVSPRGAPTAPDRDDPPTKSEVNRQGRCGELRSTRAGFLRQIIRRPNDRVDHAGKAIREQLSFAQRQL